MEGDAIVSAGKIFVTTNLAAAVATVTVMLITWIRYKKPDVSMSLNGSLAGLVAITAGCDTVSPTSAAIIGIISGFIVVFGIEFIDKFLKIDDPVGAVGVHGLNGAFGTLAVGLFSDGTAVKQVGDETYRLCRQNLDDIILVDSDEICAAIKDVFEDTRGIVEPSGALSLAGLKAWVRRNNISNKTLVAVTSGANMNFDRLRFVSERAEYGEEREALFSVTIPEERGSFRRFCESIGNRSVTEFNYRISDPKKAYIFVGIQTANSRDADKLVEAFEKSHLPTVNLTHDELAKLHLRHMIGGHSKLATNERLYRFEFPERPGALMKFLTSMAPQWNISLFHYRNNGADFGRVLVGVQVPQSDNEAFEAFLKTLGYRFWDETQNPAYKLFLGEFL